MTADRDAQDRAEVLRQVLFIYPETMTLEELVREITVASTDFSELDQIRRAIRDLTAAGLIHRVGDLVLPTRAAVHYNALPPDMTGGGHREEATATRFGRNLFMARRRAGYSQERLATLCSLHRTEIGNIENGRRIPRVDTLMRLAGALEVRAEVLLEGIEWLPPPPPLPPVGWVVQLPT